MPNTCKKMVYPKTGSFKSFHGSVCGRELNDDDQREAELCGRHLAGQRRREKTNAEWPAKWEAERRLSAESRDVLGRILTAIGSDAAGVTDGTGNVTLPLDTARRVAERLESNRSAGDNAQ